MANLLLVEDDQSLGATLKERLEKESYKVFWNNNLGDAEGTLNSQKIDLVILDVGLPDGSGFEFANKTNQLKTEATPFIFVTAQTSAEDRLKGYELGAQEFIPKPFHLKELLLRVKHVLHNHSHESVLEIGGLTIDFASHNVLQSDGRSEKIPTKECAILKLLVEVSPKVLSRDEILDRVWGEDKFPSHRTIDNMILKIRQILGEPANECIKSVRGVGYQWEKI